MMSLFDALGSAPAAGKPTSGGPMNIMQQLSQLKSNPVQMLSKAGFDVPADIGNNPQAIVQHLLNTNQVTQQRFNQSQAQVSKMMGRR